ncbi:hypothetical protein CPB83DRAFT_153619 [Crepidotus variabilis]|uniref:Uncharacterized protein n=1 Tax=Crepidotus variabilis TaxID=179855 RepID=A0A9P6EKP6_9AGAR|nr:hypothetical protein CPB83DRAFT_153619 [Crepidotus variabilis]
MLNRWFSSLTAAPETSSPLRCRVDTGFQWDADAVSERTILENLETLNSLIVNLVTPLVECVADRRYKDFNRSPELTLNALEVLADHATTFGSVEQICAYLIQNDGINNKKRSLLEECILLDRICSLLYEEFFEGDYFFGLFPGDSRVILNSLFGRIAKDRKWVPLYIDSYQMIS